MFYWQRVGFPKKVCLLLMGFNLVVSVTWTFRLVDICEKMTCLEIRISVGFSPFGPRNLS